MNRHFFYCVLTCLLVLTIRIGDGNAESGTDWFDPNQFSPNSVWRLLKEQNGQAKLYSEPKERARSVVIGAEEVILLEVAGKDVRNGLESSWYKAETKVGIEKKSGYIWGGDLAMVHLPLDASGTLRMLAGAGSTKVESSGVASIDFRIQVVKGSNVITEAIFRPSLTDFSARRPPAFFYSVKATRQPPSGLGHVQDVLVLDIFYPACGYASAKYYFLFDGKTLVGPVELPYGGEAGIFSYSSRAILPNDPGGRPDSIIIEHNENTLDGEKVTASETKRKILHWDGKRLIGNDADPNAK